ncbi:MAG: DNA recombination protein RmuC [Coriobacteriia bacterium]|nr:DNA recombination protein RmuC [Coriobacteriia bacterium]MCL2870837.1 DNA recombination protein RmuC [Coriobacteriia bacterium]
MELIVALVIGAVLGVASGFAFASFAAQKKAEPIRHRAEKAQSLEQDLASVQSELAGTKTTLVAAQSEVITLRETQARAQAQAQAYQEQLIKTEAQLAQINQQKAADLEQENKVIEKLAPVSKSVDTMKQKIAEMEEARLRQEENLHKTIDQLQATTSTLAGTLTKSQERGRWGEVQLEQIFESAGLIEGVHFDRQSTTAAGLAGGGGTRIRPDFILRLPNKRVVPIDAKVPFDAYDRACEIPLSSGPDDLLRREELLKKHALALKDHVKALSRKEYGESLDGAPDFVVAFLPAEALLSAALEADSQLVDYAFSQRVALASPVTLWSIVKSIAYAWQQQEASDNAQEIVDVGKQLLNHMANLAKKSNNLKRSLDSTVKNYNEFAATLETRVLVQAHKLQKLDMSKELPTADQSEMTTREYVKPELSEGND